MGLEDCFHRHLTSRNKDTKLILSHYFLPPMLVLQQSKRVVSFTNRPRLPLWRSSLLLTKRSRLGEKYKGFGGSSPRCLVANQQQLPPPPRPSLWRKRKKSLSLLTKLKSKSILSNNLLNSSRFKNNLLPT